MLVDCCGGREQLPTPELDLARHFGLTIPAKLETSVLSTAGSLSL